MMTITPKWRVTYTFDLGLPEVRTRTIWIYDNHIENVLRQVSMMQLSENEREQPSSISVELVPQIGQIGHVTTRSILDTMLPDIGQK